jgi:hypothetical protein
MNVLINHCWCSDSIWGGNYSCRVIVSIDRVPENKTYWEAVKNPEPDWTNLLEKDDNFEYKDGAGFPKHGTRRLRPEVIQWLKENIKDRDCDEHKQAWAVGTDKYNSNDSLSFAIFFERPTDAMKFIKRWSSYKNPVHYLNYFKDIRRKLDLKTNTLKRVPRFNS